MKNKKSYVYIGLPVLGMIFYLAYIRRSAIDMVYSGSSIPICRTCGTRISFLWQICSQEFR